MHFSPILALKAPKRRFPQLNTFFGVLGESVKLEKCDLGAFKGRNGKEYMFSIKYSLSQLWVNKLTGTVWVNKVFVLESSVACQTHAVNMPDKPSHQTGL